jgi:predicted alpha/beta-fold hydrolase
MNPVQKVQAARKARPGGLSLGGAALADYLRRGRNGHHPAPALEES